MAKRICWKKGMRLTDDILRKSDNCTIELVGNALVLAAAGRFGLLPSTSPFDLSMNINKGIVDVDRLSCSAVTKDGSLIDAHYDTTFTNTFDTRVQIPEGSGKKEFLLTIDAHPEQWKDTNNEYEEPVYSFSLIAINSPLPANSLPIAHIVDEYGWRINDVDFVPPCLYISSHQKYIELKKQFEEVLTAIDTKARNLLHSNGKEAIRIFWPVVQQLMITINKECDLMTPMELLANVQKCVSAFTCACELDEYLNLADAENFKNYIYTPYTYKDCYLQIREGLALCFSISDKIEKIGESIPPQPISNSVPSPTLFAEDLYQECGTSESNINISYDIKEAKIYFSTDGREPTIRSGRALRTKSGFRIKFDNGFRQEKGKEADKTITIKLIAMVDGDSSDTNSYNIVLHKSSKFSDAIPI
jgi:hypothetical protein